jgi:Protein of unknown function (DUF1302)
MTATGRQLLWGSIVVLLVTGVAHALPPYGPFQVTGNVQSQTLLRTPDIDKYQFIQNRNTLRLRLDYDWVKNGRLINRFDVPWIRSSHLFLLYRGVYDSVYDIAPGGNLRDIFAVPVGSLADLPRSRRDALKFENTLREAYVDVDLRNLPLSFRLGRQQVVWGETDNFRMLDRTNPLNLTWHQLYESWDDLRIPLWMIKGLWKIGYVGPLSDVFVEAYWNPGDWIPAKQGFMPDFPWGIPETNPLTLLNRLGLRGLFRGTRLFQQGDYTRNPVDNSQLGVRVNLVTPAGIQLTLNYFYQRWAGDDGTNYAPIRGLTDPAEIEEAASRGEAPAEFIAPYIHTAGLSANYSDEDYTQTVYRLETIYDFGVPFSDGAKQSPALPLVYDITRRDMWKGMIGFDRPTWIRSLNRTSTFFLSGQFFWHDIIHREPTFFGNIDPRFPSQDTVREWETIFTLAVTTFYAGGTVIPFVSYGIDPMNTYNMYIGWTLDYYLTNDLIARIGQNFFVTPGTPPVFESWSLGGFNRGRSEAVFRLTYQF